MELSNAVYHYYLTNKQLLSDDKLFHFATRMSAWRGQPETFEILRSMRDFIVQPERPLVDVIRDVLNTEQTGRRNAHELRQPFFEKYPALYGAHLALFRVRHLEAVYGIDAREALYECISEAELEALKDSLLADQEAMKVLSTFAINFCYLFERVVRRDENALPLEALYQLGKTYDINDKEQIQLLIYFYTHCIIGESNFYVRTLPEASLALYRQMIADLEPLVRDNFEAINLDNKLEFLVCARICGLESPLAERIYAECADSISEEGTFIIDRHNTNVQADRNDFVKSEHRNVLFIMSTTPFAPHSTLV
jgi:hypothetical protein